MSDFNSEILNDFLTEGIELLDQLDADLVLLEKQADDEELLNQIFRALHTIKGSASFLNITNLVSFTHVAEDALNVIRRKEVCVTEPVMDVLLRAVDVLRAQFRQLEDGLEPEPGPPDLIESLAIIARRTQPGESDAATTASNDPATETSLANEAEVATGNAPTSDEAIDSGATTASAEPARPECETDVHPQPGKLDGAEVIAFELHESKADLLAYMIEDLCESLDDLDQQIALIAEPDGRDETAASISDLAEALTRSVQFFEFEPMVSMVSLLEIAGDHLGKLDAADLEQVVPRLCAVVLLLREQADGLERGTIILRPTSLLSERLIDLLLGNNIEDHAHLPHGATAETAMKVDGVGVGSAAAGNTGSATAPLPTESECATADEGTTPEQSQSADTDGQSARSAAPVEAISDDGAIRSPTSTTPAPRSAKPEVTLRVEVKRLEALLNLVGELVIQKNRIAALARRIAGTAKLEGTLTEEISQAASDLDRVTGQIQTGVMRTRMQPLDKLFSKYPRLVRDLARSTGKHINLVIEGGDTEVDKSVIEELGDPLVHILRNSADHGIEVSEDRRAAGKQETGTIRIVAEHQGSHVMIRIIDDGAGISRARIGAAAVERGIVSQDELESMSDREVRGLIMTAGFTTADQVSNLSGRGVGMDVVRTNIQKLNGTIDIDSTEGQGTTLTIKIPLTVAILSAMMVIVGTELYAIPLTNIIEIVKPEPGQLSTVHGHPVMRLRDSVLPLVNLSREFDTSLDGRDSPFAVVVGVGDQRAGLLVSELVGQQEIVIKPLDDLVRRADSIGGATVRDDGGVSLILDVAQLIENSGAGYRQAA